MEQQHFPEGSEGAAAAEAAAKAAAEAETKAAEEAAAAETKTADEAKAKEAEEAAKAEADAKAKAEEEAENLNKKPRSIYDNYKDKKQEAKENAERAEAEKARADAAEAELARLRGEKPKDPTVPQKKDEPAEELEAFAKEQDMDPAALKRLTEIISKSIPTSQLSSEEKQVLEDLKTFKADADRRDAIRAQDEATLATAPTVKEQLAISDDKELTAVMAEVVRLSHTAKYADKEVDYIVFKEKEALSKLVSPKKPSFENGVDAPAPEAEAPLDLSKGGVTPEQVQRANQGGAKTQLEVRKAQ